MQNRRSLVLMMVAGFVALAMVVGSVIADELFGVLTKVDVEKKVLTVEEKDSDKEVKVKVNADTEWVTKKGTVKLDSEGLEKLDTTLKKVQDAGKKFNVKVTHEKGVASKVEKAKKKAD